MTYQPTTSYTFNERTLRWHDTTTGRMVKSAVALAWWATVQQAQMEQALWNVLFQNMATMLQNEVMYAQQGIAPSVRRVLRAEQNRKSDRIRRAPLKAEARAAHNTRLFFGPLSQFQSSDA